MNVHKNWIDGRWVESDHVIENINPSDTRELIGLYSRADAEQAAAAVAAARRAFPQWASAGVQARANMLDAAGTTILARREELGRLLAAEEGKTLAEAIAEVTRAGQIFKYFAGEAVRLTGDVIESVRPGISVSVTREPIGVVAAITPWNFPIAIPAWKVAPALAFGNCVVLKPAELVPGCSWALADILAEAGVPHGVFNLVMGSGGEVGAALVDSPDVDAITFTGSVAVGRQLAVAAARTQKRFQLEMGGKNPLVIMEDADLERAVEIALNGAFYSTGQRCTASSRLIAVAPIYDRFVERLIARMNALVVGHALAPQTQMGPVAYAEQLQQNIEYLDLARREGARVVGGDCPSLEHEGYYMRPALLLDTDNRMRVNREEIFGPIASVIRVQDFDEALAVANDTEFGLSAGICTGSLRYATEFKRRSEAGMVMVNLPTAGVDYHVPFGGRKGSSYGPREQGAYAREFFTIVKTAYETP